MAPLPAGTLLVTNDFPPTVGGIESYARTLCELLPGRVVVATGRRGAPGVDRVDADLARRGVAVHRRPGVVLPTPVWAREVNRLVAQHGVRTVVFVAAAPLALLAPAVRAGGARRVVGLTHGHEVGWSRVPGARSVLARALDGCDVVGAIGAWTAEQLTAAVPGVADRLVWLPPPVDTERFRPGGPSGRPVVVAAGRLVAQKGWPLLWRAWGDLVEQWPGGEEAPRLVVAGDGPLRARLQRSRPPGVELLGAVAADRMAQVYARGSLFALPVRTRRGGLHAEGLGLAALEAAACGLPVVVGDSGGAGETVARGSGSVLALPPPGAAEGAVSARLARVMRMWLSDVEASRRAGARGRAEVERRWSLAVLTERWHEVLA